MLICSLIASLACDIREDFNAYLENFLPYIVQFIIDNDKDADILKYSFDCLAHLVYFLHRLLTKNIDSTIRYV